jgi:hypothetical protein
MNEYKILRLERLNNSVNGNPRYTVYYLHIGTGDFGHAKTMSDAMFCYGIDNDMYTLNDPRVIAEMTFTRAGNIKSFNVIKKEL